MSTKHVGIRSGLIEQPGWSVTKSRDGLTTVKVQYACAADLLLDLMPAIGDPHPRFRGAELDEITGTRIEGDLAMIDCTYRSPEPGSTEAEPTAPVYQLVASTRDEPIETNERYSALTQADLKKVKDYIDTPAASLPTGTSNDSLVAELIGKKLRGQESYLCRSMVWRETQVHPAAWSSIADVGVIDAPAGSPPSLGGTGNWLLITADQTKQGSAYKRVREWLASGKEGWDSDIYGS